MYYYITMLPIRHVFFLNSGRRYKFNYLFSEFGETKYRDGSNMKMKINSAASHFRTKRYAIHRNFDTPTTRYLRQGVAPIAPLVVWSIRIYCCYCTCSIPTWIEYISTPGVENRNLNTISKTPTGTYCLLGTRYQVHVCINSSTKSPGHLVPMVSSTMTWQLHCLLCLCIPVCPACQRVLWIRGGFRNTER